ncbi:MAG TPA: type II toxin-antitoxin system VapC family toxin [Candidatus Acidoferrum sp.]|nr:type II toxin-antitoxin system VapC family toxin [Candidatus Acidoferrum sp.]
MASDLSSIPPGTNILIDTNIFVYGLTAQSSQCKTFLERCSTEEIFGITLFEVVHEATHALMIAEGRAKAWYTKAGPDYLKNHPGQVKTLSDYWHNTERVLALNIVFLPMEKNIVVGAQTERVKAGLLTNDSIIVATMREYGISRIATRDNQFDSVGGIVVFSPTDV